MTTSPAERHSTPVDGVEVLGALSPSRAGDFLTCPLLYRYRSVDRLPEPPSPAATRGTLVHKVLEDLFDLPAAERTVTAARDMLGPSWSWLLEQDAQLVELFSSDDERDAWLASCHDALERYFGLEDPTQLEPAERELYVEALLDSKLLLRGFIDRVDIAPNGMVRIVDYKTGRAPSEMFEAKALFQMKFYALVIWRTRGVLRALLQLIYLGSGDILRYTPDEADLLSTERKIEAVWQAIRRAELAGDWRPRKSPLCKWCKFQAHCPEYGNDVLPLPPDPALAEEIAEAVGSQADQ